MGNAGGQIFLKIKEKTLEIIEIPRVWWRLLDSNQWPPACEAVLMIGCSGRWIEIFVPQGFSRFFRSLKSAFSVVRPPASLLYILFVWWGKVNFTEQYWTLSFLTSLKNAEHLFSSFSIQEQGWRSANVVKRLWNETKQNKIRKDWVIYQF